MDITSDKKMILDLLDDATADQLRIIYIFVSALLA